VHRKRVKKDQPARPPTTHNQVLQSGQLCLIETLKKLGFSIKSFEDASIISNGSHCKKEMKMNFISQIEF